MARHGLGAANIQADCRGITVVRSSSRAPGARGREVVTSREHLAAQGGPHLLIIGGEAEAPTAISAAQETMASKMKSALISEGFQSGLFATWESVDALMGLLVRPSR